MATLAQKDHKRLVKQLRAAANVWLKAKDASTASIIFDNQYGWVIPDLTNESRNEVYLLERGYFCSKRYIVHYTLFGHKEISRGWEMYIYDFDEIAGCELKNMLLALQHKK